MKAEEAGTECGEQAKRKSGLHAAFLGIIMASGRKTNFQQGHSPQEGHTMSSKLITEAAQALAKAEKKAAAAAAKAEAFIAKESKKAEDAAKAKAAAIEAKVAAFVKKQADKIDAAAKAKVVKAEKELAEAKAALKAVVENHV